MSSQNVADPMVKNAASEMGVPDLSLVILCYRVGRRLDRFLDAAITSVEKATPNWEIVLVGNYCDGLDDETPMVVREIAAKHPRIKAVAKPKEGWMGWDARSGFEVCRGRAIGFIDGDEQMAAEDITKAYQLLISNQADVVKSYRVHREDSWARRVNSFVYNLIYNLLFPGYFVRDVNSKPKLFRREAFEKMRLKSKDWFLDAEMMIQARRFHFKLVEYPTVFYRAKYRKSFVRFPAIFEFLKNLAAARWKEFFISR